MIFVGFVGFPSSKWLSWAFYGFWSCSCASSGFGFKIQILWFGVVNVLIIGEIKKSSGQYLGSICDESLTCLGLNSNPGGFSGFTPICSCGESCLLVLWCACDKCSMTASDNDRGRSRRPGAEDRRWSSTGQVLDGRTIERSGDAVCGLYHAQGDVECMFLSWTSKSRSAVC
jgi:hypothetical protein